MEGFLSWGKEQDYPKEVDAFRADAESSIRPEPSGEKAKEENA